MKSFKQGSAIALLALSLPLAAASSANAMPVASSLTGPSSASDVTQVRWRSVPVIGGGGWHGGGWHGGGWHGGYHRRHGWGGAGVGLGVASGLLLGSAIAAGSSPYYYGPGYYAAPAPAYDDSVTYCMNRFRSYDPASGTYLGYDGLRHPCP